MVFLALRFAFRKQKNWEHEWVQLARRTGLNYEGKTLEQLAQEKKREAPEKIFHVAPPQQPPKLTGSWRGYRVTIDHKKVYYNDNNYRFTRYQIAASIPGNDKMSLKRRLSVSPFGRFRAPKCTKAMRSEFDLPWNIQIRGEPLSFVRSVLQRPFVRESLEEIRHPYELRIEDQTLKLGVCRLVIPVDDMESHLNMLTQLASLLEAA